MTSARDRWLDEGLTVLANQGPPALRIDQLAVRLSRSKGSFFHHFSGAAAFRTALLERYESRLADGLAAARERLSQVGPHQLLAELTAAVDSPASSVVDPALENAVRAWAYQDQEVRATQQRVDAARLELLTAVWSRLIGDGPAARTHALLPYLIVIGAAMSLTPVDRRELQQVFELILPLVPERP